VRWRPSSPIQKGGTAPNFRIMSIVAKRLDGSRCNLVSLYTDVGIGPGHTVLDVDPNPAPTKRGTDPQFTAHVCCGQMVAHLSYCGALVELWLIQLQIECLQFLSLVACTLPCTYTRVEARRWKTRKTIYYGRPIWNRAGHYIFALWFLSFFLLSFFPRLNSAVGDWMSTILPFHTWCGLSANLECMSEMCCTWLAENTGRKKIAILVPSHKFVGLYLRN